jgi:hypothetical protein
MRARASLAISAIPRAAGFTVNRQSRWPPAGMGTCSERGSDPDPSALRTRCTPRLLVTATRRARREVATQWAARAAPLARLGTVRNHVVQSRAARQEHEPPRGASSSASSSTWWCSTGCSPSCSRAPRNTQKYGVWWSRGGRWWPEYGASWSVAGGARRGVREGRARIVRAVLIAREEHASACLRMVCTRLVTCYRHIPRPTQGGPCCDVPR